MAQDGGLGLTRGAAGEQQDGDVLPVHEGQVVVGDAALGRRDQLLARDDLQPVDRLDPVGGDRTDDHHARHEAVQDGVELLVRESVVDGSERHAGKGGTEERDRQRVGVEVDEADPLRALGPQHRRDTPGPLVEGLRGHPVAVRPDDGTVAGTRRHHLEQHRQVHGRPPGRPVRSVVGPIVVTPSRYAAAGCPPHPGRTGRRGSGPRGRRLDGADVRRDGRERGLERGVVERVVGIGRGLGRADRRRGALGLRRLGRVVVER